MHNLQPIKSLPNFKDGDEQKHRQFIRRYIDKAASANASPSHKAMLRTLLNLWFKHKKHGEMHPGRAKVAKMAGVSVATVKRFMSVLRERGVLVVVSHEKGGRAATRYKLHLTKMLEFMGFQLPKEVRGELRSILVARGKFTPFSWLKKRVKMTHGIRENCTHPSNVENPYPYPYINPHNLGGLCHA